MASPNASQFPWLEEFREAVSKLYDNVETFRAASPSADEAAEVLAALHAIKADFSLAWDACNKVAVDAFGAIPEIVLSDGTKIEKRNGADRKAWQHRDLAVQVAQRIQDLSVNPDTGERTMSTADMITALLDYVAPSYWRVKALNSVGIDADRYCEVSEGKTSMIVRRSN